MNIYTTSKIERMSFSLVANNGPDDSSREIFSGKYSQLSDVLFFLGILKSELQEQQELWLVVNKEAFSSGNYNIFYSTKCLI